MTTDIMIGVDLAKNVFQLRAAGMTGAVSYRKKLSREKFRSFMAQQVPAVVVMEACGSAHYWHATARYFGTPHQDLACMEAALAVLPA